MYSVRDSSGISGLEYAGSVVSCVDYERIQTLVFRYMHIEILWAHRKLLFRGKLGLLIPMGKKSYTSPKCIEFGTVVELTAAIGASSREDQSDFPQQFPPDTGSFDVCNNNDPTTVC